MPIARRKLISSERERRPIPMPERKIKKIRGIKKVIPSIKKRRSKRKTTKLV